MKSSKKDFFSRVEIFNKVAGVWLEPETSAKWKRMLHIFTVLITNQTKMAEMKRILQDESLSYDDCPSTEGLIKRSKSFYERISIMSYFVYWMVGTSAHMSALKVLNADVPGKYFEQNSTCYDFVPHLFLIPFETETKRRCKNALIGMDFGLWIFAGYIATHDTTLYSFVSCIKAKLEILSEATRTMRERTNIKMGLPRGLELIRDAEIPEFEMEMYFEIKRSNQILAVLIRSCLYELDWFSSSRRFKQCMLIMMQRMGRPLNITIGKFSPITLQTFVAMKSDKKDFFNRMDVFNKISGVWLEPETSSKAKKMLHVVYNTLLFLYSLFFFACEILVVSYIVQELTLLVTHITMIINHVVSILEFCIIITNQRKIAELKMILQDESLLYTDCALSESLIKKSKSFYQRISIVSYFLYYMVGTSAHMSALKALNANVPGKYFEQNVTCYNFVPHLFLIPFEADTTRRCKNALIGMDLGLCVIAGYLATHDTTLYSFVSCIKVKLDILSEATRSIRGRTIRKMNLPNNFDLLHDEDFPEFEEEMYFEIKRCNKNLAILLRTVTSLVVIASCLFIASTLTIDDPEMFHLVEYGSGAFFQLFMICYFGIFITEACSSYNNAIYECNWYSSSKRFKRSMIIMMSRMGKPVHLTIGKFFPLTLRTFLVTIESFNKVAGVWLEPESSSMAIRMFFYVWDTLLAVYATSFVISEFLIIGSIMGELLLLVPHIAMLVNTCVGLLEFAILISNQAKMAKLKSVLQSEIFEYEDCNASAKIVEDSRAFYNRIMIATYLFYWMVGVGGHLSALKDLNAESRAGRYGVNTTCYNLIPHLFVIPFQTTTVKRCVDAKFQVVSEATATIRERTEFKIHIARNLEIFKDEEIPELEELMYSEIKKCNYSLMTFCCKDLERIFCYTLLGRAISSLLVIASCLYVGSFLSPRDPAMYHLVEYLIAGFFQIFMVCYFGFFITERGAAYNTYLYETDWYSCSLRFKRAMLIMMNRMQQPVYLTIGKFYPLSLQAFLQKMWSNYRKNDFFRIVEFFNKIAGVWLEPETSSTPKRLFFVTWDTFLVVYATSFVVRFVLNEFLIIGTIMEEFLLLVPHLAMLVNNCVGILEFATLISNQAKMAKMKKMLQSESFNYDECSGSEKTVEESKIFYRRVTGASYLIYWMVAVGGHLSALKNLNAESQAGNYGINTTCYNFIPHLFVIPFQTGTTRRCKNALMVMDFGLLIVAGYIATHDTVLYSFLSCINAKFQVVSEATTTIRERVALKMHLTKHFSTLNDEQFPEFEELMYSELKRCNDNLIILLRACNDLESIFCYTLLGRSISSLLVIAACLYVGSFLSPKDPEIYHIAEYLVAGFFQMFMVCYFGVFITERGAAYNTCLYKSDWYSCSIRSKRAMLIMMIRMQKPLYLTIGKFFPLTLETFVQNDFFRIIEFFNKIAGVWLEPETSSTPKRLLFVTWDTFLVVYATSFVTLRTSPALSEMFINSFFRQIVLFMSQLRAIFFSEFLIIETIMGELLLLVPHLAMLVNNCVGILEFATLISNQAKMAKLRKILQSEGLNYEECSGSEKTVEDSKIFFNRVTGVSYLVYWMVAVGAHLSALKNLNAESRAGHYGTNTTCYNFIPHLFVIPFQTETTRRCKNALMVMDFGLLIVAGYIATHDTVLYSFLSCINAKFQVVSEATMTIRERMALKMHLPDHFSILNDEQFPEFEKLMYSELKRCNDNLITLLNRFSYVAILVNCPFSYRACNDLESIFCYTLLGRSVSSLLVIAACLYVGSFLSPQNPEIYHLAEYLIGALFQMFMVCYFGVFITERKMRSIHHQDDFFRIIEFFNKIAGVWLEPETSSTVKRLLFIIWDMFLVLYATSFVISEALIIETIMGKLLLLVPHVAMLLNTCVGLFEFATLIYNQPKMAKLKKLLQSESFNYEECSNTTKIVEDSRAFYNRITIASYLIYWMVAVGGHLSALKNLNAESRAGRYGVNTTCYDLIPHLFVIPFQTDTTRRCKNALMVMDFGLLIIAGYIASKNILGTASQPFILFILAHEPCCIHFSVCERSNYNHKERTALKMHLDKHFEMLSDEQFPEFEELMYCEIKRCNANIVIL
nr:unnamed protein product [Callosobruchus chinensis]